MTSNSTSSPTRRRSSAIISAGLYPGNRRPSSSTVTSLGMTLIFSPPRTIVALTVLCSIGSKTCPLLLNKASIRSVRRGSRSPLRMVPVGNGKEAAIVYKNWRATGVMCTGRRRRSSCLSSRGSLAIAPPLMGSAPWPPGPRTTAFKKQRCFSATCKG